jgi:quinohemoprotein ethanol dehydrogenase
MTRSDNTRVMIVFAALVGFIVRSPLVEAETSAPAGAAEVNAARLAAIQQEPGQWLTSGRDREGTYYSPLNSINASNVNRLGFAWDYHLGTKRGLEATPIVVDGVMYTSGNWGRVYALDAVTGAELWTYDPQVEGQYGRYGCCDVVNRGVAAWQGRIYVASLDGYLHAIDAKTGRRIWKVDTLPARASTSFHYFITGAPLLAGDNIVIGNGGGDFKGARGAVSAFDLKSGAFRWRLYTVPRDPQLGPQDQPHLEMALKTWPSNYDWSYGGGGSAWDGLAYDPQTNLVYVGTGSSSPYSPENQAPGSGDRLYCASVLAVRGDTGRLAWHYQEVPGDHWDYDTTNKFVFADLPIGGRVRKVLMQASKDGFLYVLDRRTGEFLAGHAFSHVNWTDGLDPVTHRPRIAASADFSRSPRLLFPNAGGAHSWQPMSYDPQTRLVYIPVLDAPNVYVDTSSRPAGFIDGNFTTSFLFPEDYDPRQLEPLFGPLPPLSDLTGHDPPPKSQGFLRAYDPITGKLAWQQQSMTLWDGGILSTAGNLVIRGDASGSLNVYAADTGKLLKQIDVGTSMIAAPMTYSVGGVQYLAVMGGYGGGLLFQPFPSVSAAFKYENEGRVIAFRLDGGGTPKPPRRANVVVENPPAHEGSAAMAGRGEILYNRYCARCHVFGTALLPDLRRMSAPTHELFYKIVLDGLYQGKGMARWDDVLTQQDAQAIHSYLVEETWKAR